MSKKEDFVNKTVAKLTIAAMQQDKEAWWRALNQARWYPASIPLTSISEMVIQNVADAKGIVKAEGKSLELTVLGK